MLSSWSSSRVEYRGTRKTIEEASDKKSKKEFDKKEKGLSGFMPIMHSSGSNSEIARNIELDNDDSWLYD